MMENGENATSENVSPLIPLKFSEVEPFILFSPPPTSNFHSLLLLPAANQQQNNKKKSLKVGNYPAQH